jgi:hypothetical protein
MKSLTPQVQKAPRANMADANWGESGTISRE